MLPLQVDGYAAKINQSFEQHNARDVCWLQPISGLCESKMQITYVYCSPVSTELWLQTLQQSCLKQEGVRDNFIVS